MTAVLLLFAATPDPAAAISAAFESSDARAAFTPALGSDVEVDVVTWYAPPVAIAGSRSTVLSQQKPPALDRVFARTGVRVVHDKLAAAPAGRLVNSVGPVDSARVFWRAFRASPFAWSLSGPDVIVIAGDLPATRAAWHLLRRGRAARALWGLRASVDVLDRRNHV